MSSMIKLRAFDCIDLCLTSETLSFVIITPQSSSASIGLQRRERLGTKVELFKRGMPV